MQRLEVSCAVRRQGVNAGLECKKRLGNGWEYRTQQPSAVTCRTAKLSKNKGTYLNLYVVKSNNMSFRPYNSRLNTEEIRME